MLWLSADARTWEVVREVAQFEDDGDSVYLQGIAAGPEGFVVTSSATGPTNETGLHVIASGDGHGWFEAAPILGVGPGTQIAPLAGDWIMASPISGSQIPVWFSASGLDWEQVATLEIDSTSIADLGPLVSTRDRLFVQLWVSEADAPETVSAGVWSSSDGTTWEEVDAASDVFLAGAASSEETMVLAGDRGGIGVGREGAVFFLRSINQ